MEGIFSDIWHRVSELHLAIAPDVRTIKQWFRGEAWYVLEDRFTSRFIRVTPEAYRFLMKLRPSATVGEVWEKSLVEDAETTPTQEEVIQLLTRLHGFNLLRFEGRSESESVFERLEKQRAAELKSKLASFLYLRIPLWNPEPWLNSVRFVAHLLFNRITFILWLVLGLLATRAVFERLEAFGDQAQGVLALDNLPLLYGSLVILKLLHEFGHAFMTKRFGGTVTTMGVMLLIFTPMPYMDASSSWIFRSKYQRMLVGAAGMLVELAVAFIAALVWANTGDGLVHSLAFNLMLMGSISSLFFNGNPLLKFDAYYILSDWLEIPNLADRARLQWRSWIERYVFGAGDRAIDGGQSWRECGWLATYGALSLFYRFLVTLSIALFVADMWFLLGVAIALMAVYTWVLKPLLNYVRYLSREPSLRAVRPRAVGLTLLAVGLVLGGVWFFPIPNAFRAPGVVMARDHATVFSPVDGIVQAVHVAQGDWVEAGQALVTLEAFDLELEIERTLAQQAETEALLTLAVEDRAADLAALQERWESLRRRLEVLRERFAQTVVRAPQDGLVLSESLSQLVNTQVLEREKLSELVDPRRFEFVGVVSQDAARELFRHEALRGEIRLWGQAGVGIPVDQIEVIPYEQSLLPTAALGWKAGGAVPVAADDPEGRRTLESFFRVVVTLPDDLAASALYHHQKRGVLRFSLESEPLGEQVFRRVQQLLQRRYRL
jgi:putative peptide zinc metalloprotease protein